MIVFRADGNSEIGSGHVMRCLSIAAAARDRGVSCGFVLAGGEFQETVHRAGFETCVLGTDYRRMGDELPVLAETLDRVGAEILIVDSYFVTAAYFRGLPDGLHTAYIDDLVEFAHPADAVVNYNLYAEESKYRSLYDRAGADCPELLVGTRYAPLRKEFQNHPLREQRERISDVLVSTGGADHEHVALRYLRHLTGAENMRDYTFHFVLGAMNTDAAEIERLAEGRGNIAVHRNIAQMYALMSQCDVAITASGSTVYELCASGIPMISYTLADNQLQIADAFRDRDASLYAGDIRRAHDFPERFDRLLEELDTNMNRRRAMARRAYGMVDGNGAERIVEALLAKMP